jgi:hypothetical protein
MSLNTSMHVITNNDDPEEPSRSEVTVSTECNDTNMNAHDHQGTNIELNEGQNVRVSVHSIKGIIVL